MESRNAVPKIGHACNSIDEVCSVVSKNSVRVGVVATQKSVCLLECPPKCQPTAFFLNKSVCQFALHTEAYLFRQDRTMFEIDKTEPEASEALVLKALDDGQHFSPADLVESFHASFVVRSWKPVINLLFDMSGRRMWPAY